jgi:hypothetical protein
MNCPQCGAWTDVLETRKRKHGLTYRRYECANLHRFTTEDDALVRVDTKKPSPGRPPVGARGIT